MTSRIRCLARAIGIGIVAATCAMPARAAAPTADRALPILLYHQIRNSADGPPDSFEAISLARFESEMRYLHDHGYRTLDIDETVNFVRTGKAPGRRIVAIHFDDGWKSSQLALPVLDRYGFKATFWIIAGKGIGWPHMDRDEVQAIARNPRYGVQSHTMTHPWKTGDTLVDWIEGRTPGKGAADARWELLASRSVLAQMTGHPVTYLAWPGGKYNDTLVRMAEDAGYEALFTIENGVNRPGDDLLRLHRTVMHGGCDNRVLAQILIDGVAHECAPSVPEASAGGHDTYQAGQ
jgi:peptidoglycan/xylan/chitin deacetylase (PgdA/CDA1 family)